MYEVSGENANLELDILLKRLEEIEDGRSIVDVSKHINTLLSGDWLQTKHNLANNNAGLGGRGSNTGHASVLQGKSSKFIGSQAFRNVVKNLFDIQERGQSSTEERLNNGIKLSLSKDSEGKNLTKSQHDYFNDSKVRDEKQLSESGETNEGRNTKELGEQRVGENNDSIWQRSNDSKGVFERLGTGEKMLYRSQKKGNRLIDWSRRFGTLNVYESREKEYAYGILRKILKLNVV